MKIFLATLIICASLNASQYEVDYTKSHIQFSGKHIGTPFTGKFQKWDADITFDPIDLKNSSIKVHIYTGSAETLNAFYDATLKGKEWFDTSAFEIASFTSKSFEKSNDDAFLIRGVLQIKERQQDVAFTFKLTKDVENPNGQVVATAEFEIDRLQYSLGEKSDPDAEWVSNIIKVNLHVSAIKK